ncbi:MAG: cyclic-di-AMP receptor [Oscillospiraceae bacterium]|nr:cyclic-di-AMP receptor [Oscillospiraceae bacterium]MBQ4539217.1 cyclic-di-AMP receptor [Oscillospiraceae bacterium]
MKLIFAIVSNDDAVSLQTALTSNGFQVTRLSSTGGYLMAGNTTFICGTEDDKVDNAIEIIKANTKQHTHSVSGGLGFGILGGLSEVSVGGATIFVVDAERFEKV